MVPELHNFARMALTLSPKDQFLSNKSNRIRYVFEDTVHWCNKYLSPYASYELQAEVAKPSKILPTKICHIHYHGYIKFKNIAGFYIQSHLLASHMTIAIVPNPDDKWLTYINKDKQDNEFHFGAYYQFTNLSKDTYLETKQDEFTTQTYYNHLQQEYNKLLLKQLPDYIDSSEADVLIEDEKDEVVVPSNPQGGPSKRGGWKPPKH